MHAAVLRYLEEVARSGSIRQAAERLHIAASAVNRQILKIEGDFGVQFFERIPSGVRLTPVGELVLQHARTTLRDFEQLRSQVEELKGRKSGVVRIACLDSLVIHLLPEMIATSMAQHPAINFAVETDVHGRVMQILATGDADIGITFDLQRYPKLLAASEVAMPIMAMVGRDHPLAERCSVTIEECAAFPLLLQRDTEPIRTLIDSELLQVEQLKRPFASCNNFNLLKPLIQAGIGVGFFTAMGFVQEIRAGTIRAIPVTTASFNSLRVAIFVHRGQQMSSAAASVIELLISGLTNLGNFIGVDGLVRPPQAGLRG